MKFLFFTLITIFVANSVYADASEVNLDTPYVCSIASSNDRNIKVSSVTPPFSLRSTLGNGVILVRDKDTNESRIIDLYGSLVVYELYAVNSGFIALATPPTEARESHGSILVTSKSDTQIELNISVFQTIRAFAKADQEQAFIFGGQPQLYKLDCLTN